MAKVGRPPKYKSVKEMQVLIEKYFEDCDNHMTKKMYYDSDGALQTTYEHEPEPYTITGLALSLNMTREMLLNYQDKEEFQDTIKRAKEKCQQYAEKRLFSGGNVTGVIFNMKNNYGWKDKTEVDQNINLKAKLEDFFE